MWNLSIVCGLSKDCSCGIDIAGFSAWGFAFDVCVSDKSAKFYIVIDSAVIFVLDSIYGFVV